MVSTRVRISEVKRESVLGGACAVCISETCVIPVQLRGCGHIFCRWCLDSPSDKRCSQCQRPYEAEDYKFLDPRCGADYWEFQSIEGFKGRGRGTRYEVLWLSGDTTWEPSSNLPFESLTEFRKRARNRRSVLARCHRIAKLIRKAYSYD